MHISSTNHIKKIFFSLAISFVCITYQANAQIVWENYRNEVYDYLARMAQKGLINFDDVVKPLSRTYIAKSLQELSLHPNQLSPIEKKELQFYLQEYFNELDTSNISSTTTSYFKKDEGNRWRSFRIKSKDFLLNSDPILQGGRNYNNIKNYTHQSIGIDIWGYIGKHIGFQFSGNDITESRNIYDSFPYKQSQTGFVLLTDSSTNHNNINFSEIRASMTYSWKNGSLSLGQEYLLWGFGLNGRIVMSDKAPAYPFIRLVYQPFSWLNFQYTHAWLSSDIIDSSRTYGYGNMVYGGRRNIFIPKFMATHTITFKPIKTLDISLGESIVYSDQLDIGYLIPVMLFKIYDNLTSNNNINAGSNGQFFLQASSRNMIKKTHLYCTLLIDEIKITEVFSKSKNRNQLGYNIGGSITDIFIPYLTLNAEYTKVNPFVYSNLNPAQDFTNHNYYLGDWMGNNFDRIILSAKYTPLPKLKCLMRYQYIRKGGPGTIDQQYNQGITTPSYLTPFLFDYQFSQQEIYLNFSYQWVHNLYMSAYLSTTNENNKITGLKTTRNALGVSISYGL